MGTELAAALRTGAGKLLLRLVEVPLGVPAREADRGPVAQDLSTLFAQPVGGLAHASTIAHTVEGDGQSSR